MRWLGVAALLCLGCTRLNPAYGEAATSDEAATTVGPGGTDPGSTGPAPPDSTGPSPADTSATGLDTSTTADLPGTDLPVEPTCALAPSEGLSIVLGDPARFGGVCPTGISIHTKLLAINGSEVMLDTCTDATCLTCSGTEGHPLSMAPLAIEDHVPDGTCLWLEASELSLETETRCHWDALTIQAAAIDVPYVIATAHAADPTQAGFDLLQGAIPPPMPGIDCACETVAAGDECCAQDGPASFWHYAIGVHDVYPGESAPLELANEAALPFSFELVQAQQLHTCNDPELALSWAVVATL